MKREYVTKTLDSHKWDDYVPKDGDIVVATYYKVSPRGRQANTEHTHGHTAQTHAEKAGKEQRSERRSEGSGSHSHEHTLSLCCVVCGQCGSTWMQQIVYSLLYHGEPPTDRPVTEMAPQVEMKLLPFSWDTLPDINGRRMVKTGLPADVVPFYSNVKYIYVGRDGRDAFMSLDK